MNRKMYRKMLPGVVLALMLSATACGSREGAASEDGQDSAAAEFAAAESAGAESAAAEGMAGAETEKEKNPETGAESETETKEGQDALEIQEGMPGYTVTPEGGAVDFAADIQPEVPYWFPAQLLEWDPAQDGDLMYNKSTVPLAGRRELDKLDTVNATQNRETKVMALSIMNSNTSGNLPHGGSTAESNVFSYWQYVDTLVYWGGSSGEGLIVPPAADVTDAGHKNGVRVLGTVFLPQTAHGGKMEWLEDFLVREADGSFPVADQLIQVAEVYGFDGWFINQETEGTEEEPLTGEHASKMQEFLVYLKEQAPGMELVYYDSMTAEGRMDWQNALTEHNRMFLKGDGGENGADEMFLNFAWKDSFLASKELLKSSAAYAETWEIDPYALYAGIDLQSNGYQTLVDWSLFEAPEGGTYTSLGIYCPSWAYFSAEDMEDFRKRENGLWVNKDGDPSAAQEIKTKLQWRGISTYIAERTAVTGLPFVTYFSGGNGYSFFKNGCRISHQDWNNRSVSDILPTYRYIIRDGEGNHLTADLSLEDAWYGGSSLAVAGTMKQGVPSVIRLYSAELPVTGNTFFTVTARAKGAGMALDAVLELEDGSEKVLEGDSKAGTDWTTIRYDISGLAGKRITAISFQMTADRDAEAAEIRLGSLTIAEAGAVSKSAVSNVQVEGCGFDEDGMYAGVRLSWEADAESAYYEVYRICQDGSRSFLGLSNTESFYIDVLSRQEGEALTTFEVVPVNALLEEGQSGQAEMKWPDNSLPRADFTADITLAAPGEEITFRSLCSPNTEQVIWMLAGASLVSGEGNGETAYGETVSVTYQEEGIYPVSVKAENEAGADEVTAEEYIIITRKAAQGLELLSGNAAVWADAYVNENEAPEFAVDGDRKKKWCATGNAPHEITLDLGELRTVSTVDIYHAEAGGESAGMNTRTYSILVSQDGEAFTEVRKVTKNTAGTTHDAFAPVKARFVRLVTEEPTQGSDSAARIYEIEVYGLREGDIVR